MVKQSISFGGTLLKKNQGRSLAEVLVKAANNTGAGITYIKNDATEYFQTYQNLYQDALVILASLNQRGVKLGDKVILQIAKNYDFIPTLWACFLGGIIPVSLTIAPHYDPDNAAVKKLENIWKLLEKPLILADRELRADLEKMITQLPLEGAQIFTVDQLKNSQSFTDLKSDNLADSLPKLTPETPALLLFTSGSTGMPKGVMLTQGNLLSMTAGTVLMNQFTAQDVTLNWMPLDHVGAIVFLGLMAVDLACHQIHVPMELILKQPLQWLKLIEKHRATISWAPNFAFSLINQQAEILQTSVYDLSSMRFLVNAGEQISVKTLRLFLDILADHQLSPQAIKPAFGMTESCSGITWSSGLTAKELGEENSFISLGKPIPGATIRIVNEDNQIIPEQEIGRLQIRGDSVTEGYYNNPQITQEAFDQDGWFTTGDLGYIEQGELFITGREKQEIIINGINYFAHEIETIVEELEGVNVSYTAAFAVFDSQQETDLLVISFSPESEEFEETVKTLRKIRSHLTQKVGISPAYIIPIAADLVPKTSIGKVQKSKLKKDFEQGLFAECLEKINQYLEQERSLNRALPQSEKEQQIAAIWCDVLQLTSVGLNDNFFELGGHSLHLIRVQNQLETRFKRQLPIAEMFKNPTVASLARCLSDDSNSTGKTQQKSRQRADYRSHRQSENHDIAIIGMAGQFPGANDLTTFWENLKNGVESITFFSDEELLASGVSPELFNQPNYVKGRPILDRVEYFDSEFFGYSDREAELLDPQQRLLLRSSWECLENAGYNPRLYSGAIGIFAGASMNTYLINNCYPHRGQLDSNDQLQPFTLDSMGGFHTMVANDKDYLSTRISYKLNLRGPSVNIQTACSTGLVVIHLACQSLITGESDMALAGAISINSPQKIGYLYQEGLIISPDGHCRAFDSEAKGTIFGSGLGVILLKRLSDALADRDHIYAVIKGSAINNDGGAKLGFAAPGGEGQISAASEALAYAQVPADTVSFVEAHGTGTTLGDPIEVDALAKAYGVGKAGECALGSVKTNIGHTQIASGMAGFIKATLALQHQIIPPTLHFQNPNPQIDFSQSPFYINTEAIPWENQQRQGEKIPRRAGVNSLGIGGVNAHIILEEAPVITAEKISPTHQRSHHLLTLSARSKNALQALSDRYLNFLENHPESNLENIAFTAHTGRVHFCHRLTVIGSQITDWIEQLQQFKQGDTQTDSGLIITARINEKNPPKIAFLFPGQGAQYRGMARQLYQTQPTFQRILDQGENIYQTLTGQSLLAVVFGDSEETLTQTVYTQPALFLIEVALASVWQSWGIKPDAVLGHSLGEYAAACFAGVFDLETGLKLVIRRGQLMGKLPENEGAMASIFLDQTSVLAGSQAQGIQIAIAAINGEQHTVISGKKAAVQHLCDYFSQQGYKVRPLKVSHGFHSPLIEPMVAEFKATLAQINFAPPQIPIISNLTGEIADNRLLTPDYWLEHLLNPVQFYPGVLSLQALGCNTFIEVGPQPILLGMISSFLVAENPLFLPSLRSGSEDWQILLTSLGQLYVRGVKIDWFGFDQDYSPYRCPLPTYPFQERYHWIPLDTSSTLNPTLQAPAQNTVQDSIITQLLSEKNSDRLLQTLLKTGNYSESEKATVSNLVQQLIQLHTQTHKSPDFESLLYQLQWLPLPPQPSINLHRLKTDLDRYLEQQIQTTDLTGIALAFSEMEQLSGVFIVKALKELNLLPVQTPPNSLLSLEPVDLKEEHRKLWQHCLNILVKAGILEKLDRSYLLKKDISMSDPDLAITALMSQCPNATIELKLFQQVATQLAKILTGKIPPLSLLFSADQTVGAAPFYQQTKWAKILNQSVAKSFELLLAHYQPSEPIRVLEIGAGTGATTRQLLNLKTCKIDYTFTDVSPFFLETAKEQFSGYPHLNYQILDIEKDPETQGFTPHSYDVIIAANVLHSTQNLAEETLPHVRRLLRPGGHLLLLELTHHSQWIDLIFGITPGWWRFSDAPLRLDHPILSDTALASLLLKSGFAQVEFVSPDQTIGSPLFQQSIILAQNAETMINPTTNWLIVTDSDPETDPLPRAIQEELSQKSGSCTLMYQRENDRKEYGGIPLNMTDPQPLMDWLTTHPVDHLIYLVNDRSSTHPSQVVRDRSQTLINLVQGIQTLPQPPQLFLVTQGGQPQGLPSPSFVTQAPLWALGRVIALEHPEIWGGMIDLDPTASTEENLTALHSGLTQVVKEDHLLFRNGQTQVARLSPWKIPSTQPLRIDPQASYLITGGLGHLGLELAAHLVNLGAKQLILTTRRPFTEAIRDDEGTEVKAKLQGLEQKGASVQVYSADVGDFEQMQGVFAQIQTLAAPLRGIFHLAGVSGGDVPLGRATSEDLDGVFRAKVQGSWHLHHLSLGIPLDYFVLFSSAGAIWGAKDQGLYDAASHFLDGLAHARRLQGLPATTLNWALLAGNGIVSPDYEDWLKQIGMKEIGLDTAFEAMDAIIGSGETQVLIADVDWDRFKSIYQVKGDKSLFQQLGNAPVKSSAPKVSPTRRRLAEIAPGERQEYLLDYVSQQVGIILGLKQMPDQEQGFTEMGIDSLLSIEFKNRLEKGLDVALPASLMFDFPNIQRLVHYLMNQVLGWQTPATVQPTQTIPEDLTPTETDVNEDLLLQELSDLEAFLNH